MKPSWTTCACDPGTWAQCHLIRRTYRSRVLDWHCQFLLQNGLNELNERPDMAPIALNFSSAGWMRKSSNLSNKHSDRIFNRAFVWTWLMPSERGFFNFTRRKNCFFKFETFESKVRKPSEIECPWMPFFWEIRTIHCLRLRNRSPRWSSMCTLYRPLDCVY